MMADHTTSDTGLAAFLIATHGYVLTGIDHQGRRCIFRFDRPIPRELEARFNSSMERRLLDTHRNLKATVAKAAFATT